METTTGVVIEKSRSIHPRVQHGKTVHPKVNTSKKKNSDTIKRAIAGIEGHLENHPHDGMSQMHLDNLRKLM